MEERKTIVVSGTLPLHFRNEEYTLAPSYSSVAAAIAYGIPGGDQTSTVFIGTDSSEKSTEEPAIPKGQFKFVSVKTEHSPKDLVYSQHISRACHHSLGKSALFPRDLDVPYQEYLKFNECFVEAIQKIYKPKDSIIVLGKHFLALPFLLREKIPFAKIVLVFLSPFPPYEIFSCVPHSKKVITSMLSADRIEFQASEYISNFISTSFSLVNGQSKEVQPEDLESITSDPSVILIEKKQETTEKQNLIPKHESRDIFSLLSLSYGVGEDNLTEEDINSPPSLLLSLCSEEYLRDTLPALKLLKKTRQDKAHVVYVEELRCLVCLSLPHTPRQFLASVLNTPDYKDALEKIRKTKEGRKVVLLIETTRELGAPLEHLQAISAYLQKRKESNTDFIRCVLYGESSTVPNTFLSGLSERISAVFPGRFHTIIFPSTVVYLALLSVANVCLVGSSIDAMSPVLNEYFEANPAGVGIAPFSSGILHPRARYTLNCPYVTAEMIESILTEAPHEQTEEAQKYVKDTGEWIHALKQDKQRTEDSFSSLNNGQPISACRTIEEKTIQEIEASYKSAESRLIVLDYDGTLAEIVPNPKDAKPTPEILSLLQHVKSDKKNKLLIITGRSKEEAEEWLGALDITIYAEHGAYKRENGKWIPVPCDLSWKEDAIKVIQEYVKFTPGSHIEIKNTCVVFHCQSSGRWCANALHKLLEGRARVVTGKGIIEVRPNGVDKGSCLLKEYTKDTLTLCAGDDITDEDMFMVLYGLPSVYTICVGERSTCASHRVSDPSSLRKLLSQLSQGS
ncbi:trehalose 6-phosphate synthase/phosphatase [Nematocida sp. AWRm77]|nr:trehalose 6-phosphate synthase/phosphatase [Nematocida sp. AWRm77]